MFTIQVLRILVTGTLPGEKEIVGTLGRNKIRIEKG